MLELRQKVFKTLADITGRDEEELSEDMLLEEDLGIDSLKTLSLWQSVISLLPVGVKIDQQAMMSITRIDELLDAVDKLADAEIEMDERGAYVSDCDPGGQRIPMTHSQQFFLVSHQLVESTSLCSKVEFDGDLDIKRLRSAWESLVNRHINLQTCFYIPPDAVRLTDIEYRELHNIQINNVRVLDVTTSADVPTTLDGIFEDELNRKWDLRTWPLHEVTVAKLPNNRSALFFSNEHIISDGLGNQTLLSELVRLYDDPSVVLPSVMTGNDYVKRIDEINAHQDSDDNSLFEQHVVETSECGGVWDPQNKYDQVQSSHFCNIQFEMHLVETDRLKKYASDNNVSLYGLLVSSLLQSMYKIDNRIVPGKGGLLQLPTGGNLYPGVDLGATIGCFAQNLSLRIDLPKDITHVEHAKNIGASVQSALISGIDRTQTRLLAKAMADDFPLSDGLIPTFLLQQAKSSMRGNVYMPYTGETGMPRSSQGMALDGYRAGTKNVAGTIDVLHEINHGKLVIFFNYDKNVFDRIHIDELISLHVDQLRLLAGDSQLSSSPDDVEPSSGDVNLSNVLELVAKNTGLEGESISLDADFEHDLAIDSLARIRLITDIAIQIGDRSFARELADCRTVRDVNKKISNFSNSKYKNKSGKSTLIHSGKKDESVRLDNKLPPIPLLHIERQAYRSPARVAVESENESISYEKLNTSSNRLAWALLDTGVSPGQNVAISCRRGPDMLVAILAVLKAGAAYVPLDPEFPAERMNYIVNHARCTHWIGHADILDEKISEAGNPGSLSHVLPMDGSLRDNYQLNEISEADWTSRSDRPVVDLSADDIMVVLYTSGSTGRPKGVALNHRGYMNRFEWHQKQFNLQPGESVAQKTSCSFDVSVWELLWPLMYGGVVCAVEKQIVANPWKLSDWLANNDIAVMHFVPSLFNEFVHAIGDQKLNLPSMRWLIFSGEALQTPPVRKWMGIQDSTIKLANLYGPTEAHIDVTCHVIEDKPESDQLRIPIGSAIDNVTMLILDKNNSLITELGIQGELCIAGVQLADGYLHDAEKTDSTFIINHLSDSGIPGSKIYRTGDLAEWMGDGEIDYRGRKDSQVKLRGFRIELGEIESVICEHPKVKECIALVVDDNSTTGQELIVWYAPAAAAAQEVKDYVSKKVTTYMVPKRLIGVDALPKNHNGKLDRGAMLSQGLHNDERASAGDDARLLDDRKKAEKVKIQKLPANDINAMLESSKDSYHALSPVQHTLLWQKPSNSVGASLARFEFRGELDIDRFCDCLDEIVNRHAALRTEFRNENGQWHRYVKFKGARIEPLMFDTQDLNDEKFNIEFEVEARRVALELTIDRWPLFSLLIARRSNTHYHIAAVGSALIGDMVAGGLFARELWSQYLEPGPATGSKILSAEVPDSREYGRSLARSIEEQYEQCHNWWQDHFADIRFRTEIPKDYAAGENNAGSAVSIKLRLSKEQTAQINAAIACERTIGHYDILSAAAYRAVASMQGNRVATISHRINGRNTLPDKLYFDSIDCFATNVPLSMNIPVNSSLESLALNFHQLFNSTPFKGVSYDVLGSNLPARMWPENVVSGIRLNFLGDINPPENGQVKMVPLLGSNRVVPGHSLRSIDVEVNVSIRRNCLDFDVTYSSKMHSKSTIDTFLRNLVTQLTDFSEAHPTRSISNAA